METALTASRIWAPYEPEDMEKKPIILLTAAELSEARSRQRLLSSEEFETQRERHRLASEAFAKDAKNATSKRGLVKVAAG
jgi:hypothetical protein